MALKPIIPSSKVLSRNKLEPGPPLCSKCKLFRDSKNPRMETGGKGKLNIMLVGQNPGKQEDRLGDQFIGKIGEFLRNTLDDEFDLDLDEDFYKENGVACLTPDNRTPQAKEINSCRPRIIQAIKKIKPNVIIPLGLPAVKSIIGARWRKDIGDSVQKWVGWTIPDREYKAWICPTYHPGWVVRKIEGEYSNIIDKNIPYELFCNHLEAAIDLADTPIPDDSDESTEEEKIDKITDPDEAIAYLEYKILMGPSSVYAIDYEATGLKPQFPGHRILSVGLSCHPHHAVAMPFFSENERFMVLFKRFLANEHIKLIVHNLPMEDRWSTVIAGAKPRGWILDTMNGVHALDNRPGITGLKFVSYVRYGIAGYDDHVDKFKTSEDSNDFNRMDEVPIDEMLTYQGMDAMLTFREALFQAPKFNIDIRKLMREGIEKWQISKTT